MLVNTTYLHNKLQPSFFCYHDFTNKSTFYQAQVGYEQSSSWYYTLGAIFFNGDRVDRGFQNLVNKDQLYATVTYKFQ